MENFKVRIKIIWIYKNIDYVSIYILCCDLIFLGFVRFFLELYYGGFFIYWVFLVGMNVKMLGGVFKIDWICR